MSRKKPEEKVEEAAAPKAPAPEEPKVEEAPKVEEKELSKAVSAIAKATSEVTGVKVSARDIEVLGARLIEETGELVVVTSLGQKAIVSSDSVEILCGPGYVPEAETAAVPSDLQAIVDAAVAKALAK